MTIRRAVNVALAALVGILATRVASFATDTSQNNAVAKMGMSAAAAPSGGGSADQLPFTGSFVYNYPIEVPPGLGGLQPNLVLMYNSSAGNSWVGTGWDLSLDSIQRSTKSGVPSYASGDTFIYSSGGASQELVSVDPSSASYRCKIEEAFRKFSFNGTSWVVSDKFGTTYYFGETSGGRTGPDSSRTLVWALERVVDRNGNSLKISYTTDQGELYPSAILYTYQAGSAAVHRRVRFVLQSRPDSFSSNRGGFTQTTAQRLGEIDTEVSPSGNESGPWTPVRKYTIAYSTRTNGVRSELSSITVTGTDGTNTLSLPPTQFQYAATGTTWTVQPDNSPFQLQDYTIVNGRDNGFRFLDLNGDGRLDVLRAISLNGSLVVNAWLNTPSGWVAAPQWNISDAFVATDQNGAWWDTGIRVADLNGDGYADLIKATNYNGGFYYDAWINNKNGWTHDANTANQWKVPDTTWVFSWVQSGTWFRDNGVELVDINGDGLPDLVQGVDRDGGTANDYRRVRFNTGSGWAASDAPTGWNLPTDLTLVTADGTESVSNGTELVDLNGDGLPDLVQKIDNKDQGTTASAAWINKGGAWESAPQWIPNDYLIRRYSTKALEYGIRFADINGDGLPEMIQSVKKNEDPVLGTVNVMAVYANTGNGWRNDTTSWTIPDLFSITDQGSVDGALWSTRNWGSGILDVNGDGVPDFYRSYYDANGSTGKSIYLGSSSPELLTRITSPIGGTTDITYTNTAALTGHAIPYPVNVVSAITKNDGRGNSIRMTYAYAGGLFDSVQKEFLGFAQVDAMDADGNKTTTFFHQNKDRNGTLVPQNALKGRPYEVDQYDNANHLLTSQKTQWDYANPFPNVYFVRPTNVQSILSDVAPALTTETDYTYDGYGNVIKAVSLGDVAVSGDEKTVVTDYALNASAYLVGFPCHTVLQDATGQPVAETETFYDGSTTLGTITTGNATQVQRRADMTLNQWVTTHMSYYPNGQLATVTDANGHATSTTYDAYGFPATATNALNQSVHTLYDLRTGNDVQDTDLNGQITKYTYDLLGRQVSVVGPLDSDTFPTVQYDYHGTFLGNPGAQYTETISRLHRGTSSTVSTKNYFDGLGRPYHAETPTTGGTVFTDTLFNERGLPFKTSVPRLLSDPNAQYTVTTYDSLGRVIRVDHPDGTFTKTTYQGRSTSVQDENNHVQSSVTDAYGHVLQRTEPGIAHPTLYAYDAAGNATSVTDAAGHATTFSYDALGRKLTMTDPNAGTWSYGYDDAGNLTSQTDARGVKITMTYDALNRLSTKVLAADPGAVTGQTVGSTLAGYTYDEPKTGSFSVGRLTTRTDLSGLTKLTYDALGEVVQEDQTVSGVIYTTKTNFDEGRPTQVIYPNGTAVSYAYNSVGQLLSVTNGTTTYAAFPTYDALGHVIERDLSSSQIRTTYAYDPASQALASVQTQAGGTGPRLQDLAYHYDNVKNITSLTDNVHPDRTQTFHYDALDRLTQAQGVYGTQNFSYDDTGNFLTNDHTIYSYGDVSHPSRVTQTQSSVMPGVDASTVLAWNLDPSEPIYAISGTVTNGGGQGVSTVPVVLSGLVEEAVVTGTSPSAGQFQFRGVPGGAGADYSVLVASVGMSATPAGYALNGLTANQTNDNFVLSASTSALAVANVRVPRTRIAMGSPLPRESTGTFTAGLIGGFGYGGTTSTGGGFSQLSGYSPLSDPSDTQQQSTTTYTPPPAAVTQNVVGPSFVPGRFQQALSFNGTSDAFVIPGSQNVNPSLITLMVWAKPANGYPAAGYATLLAKAPDVAASTGTVTSGYRLVMDKNGRAIFEIGKAIGSVCLRSTSALPLAKWTFLAATYDGSQMKLYVNGQLDGVLASSVPVLSNTVPVSLGASMNASRQLAAGTLFSGALDEPRIQNRAWSDVEIADTWEEFDNAGVYTYDANGNRLTENVYGSTTSYQYDAEGRLASLAQDGSWQASYVYDADGSRVKKITGAGTTLYLGKLYEERPDGRRIDHVYAGGQLVCDLVTPPAGAAQTYYYLTDHLGSVSLVADSAGNVLQDTTYEPFGAIYDSSGTSPNHRFYTGQEADDESDLYYYNARYYDPTMGRFISPDSIVPSAMDPQSLNRYVYCRNNPIVLTDPSGHSWLSHESGIHVDVNRFVHHTLGINRMSLGYYAGIGGELSFSFTDDRCRVGGGVGVGIGGHLGISSGSFDIFIGHGAAAAVGYDPTYGPYASAWGGCVFGPNGSATYYFRSSTYQVSAGYGVGNFGANVGYSNVGGTTVGADYGGLGATYDLQTHETRGSISVNDQDLEKAYADGVAHRRYDGYSAGPIVDFIGTVTAGWIAADNHDSNYRIPLESKAGADLELMTDMAKGAIDNLRQPGGFARAAVGVAIAPIYYFAVAIGGGPAYRADQRSHLGR